MSTKDPREYWNQQAPGYASDDGHRRFGRFLDLYEEGCWRYIEPVLPGIDTSVILEAGCGTGRWVTRLAPMGYRVMLSDLSPEMVEHAHEKIEQLGLSDRVAGYYALDICDMHALPNASFDLVLALGGPLSLCHDASLAVSEFHRVTRPGGYVVCDTANRYRTALDLVRENEAGQLASVLAGQLASALADQLASVLAGQLASVLADQLASVLADQLASVLDTGRFLRRDGLVDHRFDPQGLADLFAANGWEVVHVAGICPLFEYLPSTEQVRLLDDEHLFEAMRDIGRRYAEDPFMVALSGRLLIVARRWE